jgi:hypothetical protein
LLAKVRSTGVQGARVHSAGITVVGRGHSVFCSCEDWLKRGVACKHIAAVALHELGAQAAARTLLKSSSKIIAGTAPGNVIISLPSFFARQLRLPFSFLGARLF